MMLWGFGIAFVISFIGSLQPGPVNMSVLSRAADGEYKAAIFLATGGCLPELIFTYVAIKFTPYFISPNQHIETITTALNVIFLLLGIYQLVLYFLKHKKPLNIRNNVSFMKGFMLALFNPQLLLFWVGICSWLSLHHLAPNNIPAQAGFVLGSFGGAYLVQLIFIQLMRYYAHKRLVNMLSIYGELVGALLVLMIGGYGLCQ